MALEDRCSPQSANSPPGVPQSPQSNHSHPFHHPASPSSSSSGACPTTSMLMLINNVIDSKTKMAMDYEMTTNGGGAPLKSADMSPSQLLSSIASKNLFNIQHQFKFRHEPKHPPSSPSIRTDDEDLDEDDEIDIENDPPKDKFLLPSPASPASSSHSSSPQISSPSPKSTTTTASANLKFSISQILSDSFGIESKFHQHAVASAAAAATAAAMAKFKSTGHLPNPFYPHHHHHPHPHAHPGMLPGHHHPHPHSLLFRPYEMDLAAAAAAAAAAQQQQQQQQKMKSNFSSLFSSFQQSQQHLSNGASRNSLEDFCDSKLSQLSNGGGSNGLSNGGGRSGEHRPVISSSPSGSSGNNNNCSINANGKSMASSTATTTSSSSAATLRTDSGVDSSDDTKSETASTKDDNGEALWPAWIYCTRYSDRPSSGPRYRRPKKPKDKTVPEDKRPRTAFSNEQLARLKREFNENRYLNERRRQELSAELGLNEAQIKIWFQNKRAKIKKTSGQKNPLAMQLMAQGLYNHSTVPLTKEEEELEMRMNGQLFD